MAEDSDVSSIPPMEKAPTITATPESELHRSPSAWQRKESQIKHGRQQQSASREDMPALEPRYHEDKTSTRDNVRKITGVRWFLLCSALYATALLYGLDTTIAADVQSAVIETFEDISQLAWLGAGLTLNSVAVILPYGALYSMFSLKYLYIAGVILFEIGSALCGAAPSMNVLVVGRVIAGMGGTGMYLGVLNHISAFTTPEERETYINGIEFVWGIGACLGPVIGGLFSVSKATWRWGFYINLVIGAATAPIYIFNLPNVHPVRGVSLWDQIKSINYVGSILSARLWVTFSLAFVFADGAWKWQDGRTIATIIVFGLLTMLYMIQLYFSILTTPETRSFPVHLLRSRSQILTAVCSAASFTALYIPTYFIPIYFQFVQSGTALKAAVRLLPFLLVAVAFNLTSGYLLSKLKYYMPMYLVSGIIITVGGSFLYIFLEPETPTASIYGISVLLAAGTGLTMQIGYAVATLKVTLEDVAKSLIRNVSGVLSGQGFSDEQIRAIIAGSQSTLFEQISEDMKANVILAITEVMQAPVILVIVSGAMILVSTAAMKREKLFGEIVAVG
ncbi:major facilitator superfamily domain-containing protein [Trichoderma chlorosporum]